MFSSLYMHDFASLWKVVQTTKVFTRTVTYLNDRLVIQS
jgi:hypothetical protein